MCFEMVAIKKKYIKKNPQWENPANALLVGGATNPLVLQNQVNYIVNDWQTGSCVVQYTSFQYTTCILWTNDFHQNYVIFDIFCFTTKFCK